MQFEGEHLLIGKAGHFFVLLSFVSSLLALAGYAIATQKSILQEKASWVRFARINFFIQVAAVLVVFGIIFYICANHYLEYLFAYKHTSKELEFKYLLACIWEDQSGSFLLWSIWHCILGVMLMKTTREWEAPVMTVVSFAQVFLVMMIMGISLGNVKIGNSPFVLTRNEIAAPIFSRPEYLSFIKDGVGLNVLLRNYWMVIHPPVLFLGFASTLIPFAFAYAGIITKRFGDWVKPALPYALFSACVLGAGIMMGGKWAYESLSFGGYWAWDPVENASLVPWLILIAGIHTMIIYKATGRSLRASYLFAILTFVFVLYSTFLTRTGVLGETSVHAFADAGNAMYLLILGFFAFFTIASLLLFFINFKKIPAIQQEEAGNSREFWMFIGALVLFLSSLFISFKTSLPVINKIFGTKMAPPENVEFSYNKVMVMVAVIVGILTAIAQYFKYKSTPSGQVIKKIALPTFIAALITGILAVFYPITYYKEGGGFLVAIYVALFASIYAVVANTGFIWSGLNGKFKAAGGSISHIGFTLMIAGMLISAGNKKIISQEKFKNFNIPMGIDPLTKQADNAAENLNLVRHLPTPMADYEVTYLYDSSGHETGRRFYHLLFERKDADTKKVKESFVLNPDVYVMKDNNMSSNPDTRSYLTHDVFTYVSYALNPSKETDTTSFKEYEVSEGDTMFYSKGFIVFNKAVKNPETNKFKIPATGPAVLADLSIVTQDSNRYSATPMLLIEDSTLRRVDDTVFAQNLYLKFANVNPATNKIIIGVKESDKMIDFVTVKAYIFPYINLVWIGLIIMSIGIAVSMVARGKFSKKVGIAVILAVSAGMFYMFLLANA